MWHTLTVCVTFLEFVSLLKIKLTHFMEFCVTF
nr:MAG TPA: hypothetical protein [Bacteriophage sp.]